MRHQAKKMMFVMLVLAGGLVHVGIVKAESASEIVASTTKNSAFSSLKWDEIRPSAMQNESLLSDHPRGRAVVNSNTNDLWIVGERHLWKWSLRDGAMSRVVLPSETVNSLQLVYASNKLIYGIDSSGAWAFELATKTWSRFDGRFDIKCSPKKVSPFRPSDEHSLFLMTDCGIFILFFDSKQLIAAGGDKLELNPRFPMTMASRVGDGSSSLLAIHNQEILQLSIKGSKIHKELIYTAKSPLLGIVKSGEWYVAWARQAIIMFDKKMVRQQVVPVIGTRIITSFAGTATKHAVGFSDGSIELMDLPSKKKWSASKNEYLTQYLDFTTDESLLILSAETSMPRVFSMTNIK